jgi:hypothetical protein
MDHPLFPVSVVMRRVPIENRWASHRWDVAEVSADTAHDALTREEIGPDTWRWRGFRLDLHPSEAEGYYLNVSAPQPSVFVMWRLEEWCGEETARPWVTTVSYHEAARMMDGGERVDRIAMPEDIHAWVAPWVATHYQPETRRKLKRNQAFWQDDARGADGHRSAEKREQGAGSAEAMADAPSGRATRGDGSER